MIDRNKSLDLDKNESLDLDSESAKKILNVELKIEKKISQFFKWKTTLREICEEIRESQKFDFVSISLVSLEQNTIETYEGNGCVTDWLNIAKHYLEKDERIRDIQAAVYHTKKTEIITGFDKRFDKWLYERYHHDKFTRVFTPIFLVRNEQGKVIKDWQEQCKWEVVEREEALDKEGNKKGSTISLEIKFPQNLVASDVIAVIEAGYKNSETPITEDQGIKLANFVGRYSKQVYETSLSHILEIIAESAVDIMEADCATLHFLSNHNKDKYIYEVCAGDIGHLYLKKRDFSPRESGLGQLAIEEEKHQSASASERSNFQNQDKVSLNPNCKEDGIISSVAFPLIIDKDSNRFGFLCIHYRTEFDFRKKIELGYFYAERVVNIIANVFRYKLEKDRVNQVKTLHSVASSIANPPKDIDLLPHIACNILNVLAADIVTIYEYNYIKKEFNQKPYIAGKLIVKNDKRYYNVERHYVPRELFENDTNFKKDLFLPVESLDENPIFRKSTFAIEEEIDSVACVKLEINSIPVGLMFINYRRPHIFADEEKDLIKILAYSSALAIKNQGDSDSWLTDMIDIDRKIRTTLDRDKLLELIVEKAVKVTEANVGDIFLLEKIDQKLIRAVSYPDDLHCDQKYEQIDIGVGIIGKVAETRKSLIIDNVDDTEHNYIRYYRGPKMRSELCVPIIYSDDTIIGIINVESTRLRNFKEKHNLLLKAIANQAAIALRNTSTSNKQIATEKMAILGSLSGSVVHELTNTLGLVQQCVKDLASQTQNSKVDKIANLVDKISQAITAWKAPIDDETKEPISIIFEIYQAIYKIEKDKLGFLKNVKININPDLGDPKVFDLKVRAEKLIIREIFINLLTNAQEAIAEKSIASGTISIDCSSFNLQGKSWIRIAVHDNGKRIDKPSKVFELGYSTKNKEKSLKRGTGLWLTKLFVEYLEGEIKAYNHQEKGDKFILILPKLDL